MLDLTGGRDSLIMGVSLWLRLWRPGERGGAGEKENRTGDFMAVTLDLELWKLEVASGLDNMSGIRPLDIFYVAFLAQCGGFVRFAAGAAQVGVDGVGDLMRAHIASS